MEKSAGLIILWNKKILLVHPTRASRKKTYSIPKGGIEGSEKKIDAAIRETKEETGIEIKISQIKKEGPTINYKKEERIYKKIFTFIVEISSLDEIGLKKPNVPRKQLQAKEVDWAGFVSIGELEEKLFPRLFEIVDIVKGEEK